MVILMQYRNWDIKCTLVDPGSSVDVLFLDAFQKLHLDPDDIKTFMGSLIGLSKDKVKVRGHVTLETTCN